MKKLSGLFIAIFVICGCSYNSENKKEHKKRDSIINIKDKIVEIQTEVLFGRIAIPNIINNHLIIVDYLSSDELIHIFDINNFNHLTSIAYRGQGPGEIANMGRVGIDEKNNILYVTDHGKQNILSYNIDSVFLNQFYTPDEKIKIQERFFPNNYLFINDSISISQIISPTGDSGYNQSTAKFNINTGEIKLMPYEHPQIKIKRVKIGLSTEDSIYVECYSHNDLMSIFDLNGNLIDNIYGPNWSSKNTNEHKHYGGVLIGNKKIIASYCGENDFSTDKSIGIQTDNPTKFLVFDINGNYLQTLETGYQILDICYDKKNNRIIMMLDDDIQLAYFDFDEIIPE